MDADTHSVMKHNCIVCELVLPEIEAQNDRLKLENRKLRAEVERLKDHVPDATKMIRPDPSRLEIAAMMKAAWYSSPNFDYVRSRPFTDRYWLEQADALIAAAKE